MAAIRRRVAHLRQHSAPQNTYLAAVVKVNKWATICSTEITAALCAATKIIGTHVRITPDDVIARSMWAGGAISLLMTRVNTDTISCVGRWRSAAMLCYLHTTAETFTEGIAARMVQHGDYALIPPSHGD